MRFEWRNPEKITGTTAKQGQEPKDQLSWGRDSHSWEPGNKRGGKTAWNPTGEDLGCQGEDLGLTEGNGKPQGNEVS